MRIYFILIFFLTSLLGVAQSGQPVPIRGTHCSLVPPDSFEVADRFSGFQHAKYHATIMVNELPAPYHLIVEGFSAEALQAKGMTLISKETIDFNSSKASFLRLTQQFNGSSIAKQILVFGDSSQSVIVMAMYPESSVLLAPILQKALLSTIYHSESNPDLLSAVNFSINTDGTEFRPTKLMAGALLYTIDGKIPTHQPTLIVSGSLLKVKITDLENFAEQHLKKIPDGNDMTIQSEKAITIDQMRGYELVAKTSDLEDSPKLIYQVILISDTGYYFSIVGESTIKFDHYLAIFQALARTFKRK